MQDNFVLEIEKQVNKACMKWERNFLDCVCGHRIKVLCNSFVQVFEAQKNHAHSFLKGSKTLPKDFIEMRRSKLKVSLKFRRQNQKVFTMPGKQIILNDNQSPFFGGEGGGEGKFSLFSGHVKKKFDKK